ncbi:MAG: RluA family pseudouridine synthase [Spirochaetaceae bacterium]|jgi:23S rRNA pseudouridine955/2504/2580 synthase|nr:RluA family pseudouridine synthase [Spirochaetaceae bacterium]
MTVSLTAGKDDDGRRLDRVLRKALPDVPLSALHRLMRRGDILVNGGTYGHSSPVHAGDLIIVHYKKTAESTGNLCKQEQRPLHRVADQKAFEVLFENDALLIVNKNAGLVTHGANSLETFVNTYLESKLPPSLSFKPGPLHRLDRETSGVIVFSKSIEGARYFSKGLREGLFRKIYLTRVCGIIQHEVLWEDHLERDHFQKKTFARDRANAQSRRAKTYVTPLEISHATTLVKVEIQTGRTHQIRASAAAHGHPLKGDKKYGGGSGKFFLHAWMLEFPDGNQLDIPSCITAPPPPFFNIHD